MKHDLAISKGLYLPGLVFLLWIAGSHFSLWNAYIIPPPAEVAAAFAQVVADGSLSKHLAASFARVFSGFGAALLLAFPAAVALGMNKHWNPYVHISLECLRHIPPLATIPILILWFGIGEASKLAVILMAAFFPLFLNALDGIRRCDPGLVEVGRTLGFSRGRVLRRIVLPAALPSILTGLRLGLGYSWRALIGAELIAASSGLGYLIHDAESLSRPDVIVAGVLALGCVGSLSDHLFFRLADRLVPWRAEGGTRDGWG